MPIRPITLLPHEVRAVREGRQTQLRRIARVFEPEVGSGPKAIPKGICTPGLGAPFLHPPPFAPGDILWARETWASVPATAYRMSGGVFKTVNPADPYEAAIYRAGWERSTGGFRWRPPVTMPRWASRTTLTVTDVRCQRVAEISEEDAEAEGVKAEWTCLNPGTGSYALAKDEREAFAGLWDSVHGHDAWASNPWVWACTFSAEMRNVDAREAAYEKDSNAFRRLPPAVSCAEI